MRKDRAGNYFEDFRVGMRIRHATPRTLTEGDRSLYIGLTGSRTALCTAETNAQRLGFDRRPLEDLLVFNTAFGKTVPDISLNAVANLGYSDVRFLAPVYPGDTLTVETEILGLKENASRKTGVVYVRSTASNQLGLNVLTWIRWVMVHKRDPGAPCGEAVVPTLNASVPTERLPCGDYSARVREIGSMTGVSALWDDYAAGERIDHPGAMTVNESDHSIATRLYQNTAKAHFDGFAATARGTKRLVYGGHVMSICKALAYDGLENGLSILAINGGSHVNPTYAGDTIACSTMVLDKIDLGLGHIGGLRLRTIGVKNAAASSIAFPDAGGTRPIHPEHVVLDLDYTIAIPR
ncbi:Beta-methylmalyl-CoA dehydratase [Paraburkholderia caffeinitolerans]|uniref:Beta-methylmalyl-CoA dehydratase n=1 Tax=Paraburkholderia caffeinitolerans TaxID=1723730 RepID=A0A6J5G3U7_9BURK|nr:MaoC family dehydratase [Paraburkholderia caffeinitolerans]CAB3790967.1 Beta-methylmalyl-CoA dehydratase [Paraburkholderia caffeinitolerans]